MSFLRDSVAPSTQRTYLSGVRAYVNFCLSVALNSFPASEASLCFFSVSCANRCISFKTIKVYINGILFQNTLLGYNLNIRSMSVLYRTLRGIRRRQGNSLTRPPRNPITIQHLHRISHFLLQSQFATQDKYMFLSSCLIAFFGLLRVSEYTCPSQTRFDPSLHLCRGNISFSNDFSMVFSAPKG